MSAALKLKPSTSTTKKPTLKDFLTETPRSQHDTQTFVTRTHFNFTSGVTEAKKRSTMRRNYDPANLTTSRLPDIEPVVKPSTYLHWRYMNRRGSSNTAWERNNESLRLRAQNAINAFERKMKKEDERLRQVRE